MERPRPLLIMVPVEMRVMICWHLSDGDLFNMALLCRATREAATEVLYRRDAAESSSSAILWAAFTSGHREPGPGQTRHPSLNTLDLSIAFGGDVNAVHRKDNYFTAAIHAAAAVGSLPFLQHLFHHGAVASSYSRGFCHFLDNFPKLCELQIQKRKLQDIARRHAIDTLIWLPLLLAVSRGDFDFVRCIADAGCQSYLAVRLTDFHQLSSPNQKLPRLQSSLTVIHVLTMDNLFTDNWSNILRRFPEAIDCLHPLHGMSALMKLAENGNAPAVDMLLKFNQNVNTPSTMGWTALLYAVHSVVVIPTKAATATVARLLQKGAAQDVANGAHALTILLEGALLFGQDPKLLRSMVGMLLDNGADVNVEQPDGCTASQRLFLEINRNPAPRELRNMFDQFLRKGANVNELFGDGTTMLEKCFTEDFQNYDLANKLLQYNARFTHRSANHLFRLWTEKKLVLSKMALPEGWEWPFLPELVGQGAVDKGYRTIFLLRNAQRFEELRKQRGDTKEPDLLVDLMLRQETGWRKDEILELEFDPNWRNEFSDTYAHTIVDNLTSGRCTDKAALEDLQHFEDRGIDLAVLDALGLTPCQKLTLYRLEYGDEGVKPTKTEVHLLCADAKRALSEKNKI